MHDKKKDYEINAIKCSVPISNVYQKEINHHVRNTLQIIISLTDLYAHRIKDHEAFSMLFTLLESQYRALSCPYDIMKEADGTKKADLLEVFQWFQDYFENTPLFFTKKSAVYIHCPKGITIPYVEAQHLALWVHELFINVLMIQDNSRENNDIHIYINTKENHVFICIKFVQNTTVDSYKMDVADKGAIDIVKSLNTELFVLLLNQLKGQQIDTYCFTLPIGLCE